MIITQEQLRAGRALLHLDQAELARRAHVSVATIRRIEAVEGVSRVAAVTLESVRRALEDAGAEFIPHGVRRRSSVTDKEALFRDLLAIAKRSAARLRGQDTMNEADLYNEDGLPA
jgi:transcriptional regulator with XRE-family HTH domain